MYSLTPDNKNAWPLYSLWFEMYGGSIQRECWKQESRKGKESKGLLHLRSLDVLIRFCNKAALLGRVLLIWTNLSTAGLPLCHR